MCEAPPESVALGVALDSGDEAKINQALQEERCGLEMSILVTARGNVPQLTIFAED